MPICCMRSRSRTSHVSPSSCAIALARSAIEVGVRRLGGSTEISREKLIASPETRPRSKAVSRAPSPLRTAIETDSMLVYFFFRCFEMIGLPCARQNTFGHGRDMSGSRDLIIQEKNRPLDALSLEEANGRARDFPECCRIAFFSLAAARYQQSARSKAGWGCATK